MMKEENTDLGEIRIHKNVIAAIASVAIQEVEGAIKIKSNLKSSLYEFLGRQDYPGINVWLTKNNEAKLEIKLNVKFGHYIPEVSKKLQETVRKAIDKMTDVTLQEVNITVVGIERG